MAPQHALTIGCFATLLIGLGTRVTLGHSGLPMQLDKPVMLMFLGIQLVAILRVLADMLPGQNGYWLYVAAAGLSWLASPLGCCAICRYMCSRERTDRRGNTCRKRPDASLNQQQPERGIYETCVPVKPGWILDNQTKISV